MPDVRNGCKFLEGNLYNSNNSVNLITRDYLRHPDVEGRIILRQKIEAWTGLN
jgi:hypothetical protein